MSSDSGQNLDPGLTEAQLKYLDNKFADSASFLLQEDRQKVASEKDMEAFRVYRYFLKKHNNFFKDPQSEGKCERKCSNSKRCMESKCSSKKSTRSKCESKNATTTKYPAVLRTGLSNEENNFLTKHYETENFIPQYERQKVTQQQHIDEYKVYRHFHNKYVLGDEGPNRRGSAESDKVIQHTKSFKADREKEESYKRQMEDEFAKNRYPSKETIEKLSRDHDKTEGQIDAVFMRKRVLQDTGKLPVPSSQNRDDGVHEFNRQQQNRIINEYSQHGAVGRAAKQQICLDYKCEPQTIDNFIKQYYQRKKAEEEEKVADHKAQVIKRFQTPFYLAEEKAKLQEKQLEDAWSREKFPTDENVKDMTEKIGRTENQIKSWFKRKRALGLSGKLAPPEGQKTDDHKTLTAKEKLVISNEVIKRHTFGEIRPLSKEFDCNPRTIGSYARSPESSDELKMENIDDIQLERKTSARPEDNKVANELRKTVWTPSAYELLEKEKSEALKEEFFKNRYPTKDRKRELAAKYQTNDAAIEGYFLKMRAFQDAGLIIVPKTQNKIDTHQLTNEQIKQLQRDINNPSFTNDIQKRLANKWHCDFNTISKQMKEIKAAS